MSFENSSKSDDTTVMQMLQAVMSINRKPRHLTRVMGAGNQINNQRSCMLLRSIPTTNMSTLHIHSGMVLLVKPKNFQPRPIGTVCAQSDGCCSISNSRHILRAQLDNTPS